MNVKFNNELLQFTIIYNATNNNLQSFINHDMDKQEIQMPEDHKDKMNNCDSVVDPDNLSALFKYVSKMDFDVLANNNGVTS